MRPPSSSWARSTASRTPTSASRTATSGGLNWKGFALILRLHYKDHAQQAHKALETVAARP
jgi:hypothetical protein